MRLIDADALKKAFKKSEDYHSLKLPNDAIIDNAPTVEPEKTRGECRTCRHRDPEDKKCDCGGMERQGCRFPVRDDYFCKFYEKGGEES